MLKIIHSYWAYVVVVLLFIVVINAWIKIIKKTPVFTDKDFRLALFGLIVTHIQFLIGLLTYFVSPRLQMWSSGGVMKNKGARLLLLEHPLMVILAIVLITMGWSKHKKQPLAAQKFKKIGILYGVGLLLILSRVPWFG